jgi:hypothetical protein
MFGRDSTRNAVSPEKGLLLAWQTEERNKGCLTNSSADSRCVGRRALRRSPNVTPSTKSLTK